MSNLNANMLPHAHAAATISQLSAQKVALGPLELDGVDVAVCTLNIRTFLFEARERDDIGLLEGRVDANQKTNDQGTGTNADCEEMSQCIGWGRERGW